MSDCGSGTILLTGWGVALEPNPEYLSLSIGKADIRALAHGLFESLKEKGIQVATVTVAAHMPPKWGGNGQAPKNVSTAKLPG